MSLTDVEVPEMVTASRILRVVGQPRNGYAGGGYPSTSELSTEPALYTEQDRPNPINVYGASKMAGEIWTEQGETRHLVVRVARLFRPCGARGKGRNFVMTVLTEAMTVGPLRVVNDIINEPHVHP